MESVYLQVYQLFYCLTFFLIFFLHRCFLCFSQRYFGSRSSLHLRKLHLFSFQFSPVAESGHFHIWPTLDWFNDVIHLQVVTKFADCISITKEKLARIFPNSICIHSESKGKQLFTSFTSRDRTFAQISRIWELSKNEQV